MRIDLNAQRAGDAFTARELDRLGPNAFRLSGPLKDLEAWGVFIESLTEGIDNSQNMRELPFHILVAPVG